LKKASQQKKQHNDRFLKDKKEPANFIQIRFHAKTPGKKVADRAQTSSDILAMLAAFSCHLLGNICCAGLARAEVVKCV